MLRRALILTAAGAAAASLAAPAAAAPRPEPHLSVDGTNGYRIVVDGYADQVTVTARRGKGGATYSVDGEVSRNGRRIQADLGRFGLVDVEFEATRKRTIRQPPNCRGRSRTRRGVWEGTIQFVAEAAITSVATTTAPGRVRSDSLRCPVGPGVPDERTETLEALRFTKHPVRELTMFGAFRRPGRKATIGASHSIKEDGVFASYSTFVRAGRSAFRYNRERGRAAVRPPAPFAGKAKFRKHRRLGDRWTGDLAVTLPAIGTIALTGPKFFASLGGQDAILIAEPAPGPERP